MIALLLALLTVDRNDPCAGQLATRTVVCVGREGPGEECYWVETGRWVDPATGTCHLVGYCGGDCAEVTP